MPRGDTTGPMGQGPMTGRAAGFCAGYNVPGYGNTVPAGRGGFGRGCGFRAAGRGAGRANGRGFGFGGYATGSQAAGTPGAELSPENERDVLSRQQDYLKKELEAGITTVAEIVDNGTDIPGTHLPATTKQFRELFFSADVVISKGQGNFETLLDEDRDIFCILQIKCESLAKRNNRSLGDWVVTKTGKGVQ